MHWLRTNIHSRGKNKTHHNQIPVARSVASEYSEQFQLCVDCLIAKNVIFIIIKIVPICSPLKRSLREINPLMGNTCLSSCPTKLSTPGQCFPGGRHYNVKGHLPREGAMKSTLRLRWRSTPGEAGTAVQAERRTHGSPNRGRYYRSGQRPYRFRMRLSV